jgi:hypothetical protein
MQESGKRGDIFLEMSPGSRACRVFQFKVKILKTIPSKVSENIGVKGFCPFLHIKKTSSFSPSKEEKYLTAVLSHLYPT